MDIISMKIDCLRWWTHQLFHPLYTCSLFPIVILQLSCQLLHSMFDQGQLSGQISGLPTTKWGDLLEWLVMTLSITFVAPSGVHTQDIKSCWNCTKHKFKKMKGCQREMFPSYPDEYMGREQHGSTSSQAFASLCREQKINILYITIFYYPHICIHVLLNYIVFVHVLHSTCIAIFTYI